MRPVGQSMVRQLTRFLATGGLSTVIHMCTVLGVVHFVVPMPSQVLANGIAFLVANSFSYVVNSLWSFTTPLQGLRFLKFLSVSLIGFMGTLLVAFLAEQIGLTPFGGVILVVCTVTPISFILHRYWTFR